MTKAAAKLRQVNHACGGGLKYLGANSGVDGVSSCVLSKLGFSRRFWMKMGIPGRARYWIMNG